MKFTALDEIRHIKGADINECFSLMEEQSVLSYNSTDLLVTERWDGLRWVNTSVRTFPFTQSYTHDICPFTEPAVFHQSRKTNSPGHRSDSTPVWSWTLRDAASRCNHTASRWKHHLLWIPTSTLAPIMKRRKLAPPLYFFYILAH